MIMTKLNKLIQPVLSTLPSGREGGRWLPRLVSAGWMNVLLLFTLLALWAAGIYSLFRWAPGWEYLSLQDAVATVVRQAARLPGGVA